MNHRYCVRPNSGRIEAGQDVEVQGTASLECNTRAGKADKHLVLLQAMKEDPPPDARCRDKFLVQSVAISAGNEATNISTVVGERLVLLPLLPTDGSTVVEH